MNNTPVGQFFEDLDGSQFERELGKVLSAVSAAVVDHNKTGEVKITLKMKQIGGSHQIQVEHSLAYERPTARGKQTEKSTGITPMYVGAGGITFFPDNQGQLLGKTGQVASGRDRFPNEKDG